MIKKRLLHKEGGMDGEDFDGATYEAELDKVRLTKQLARMFRFMSDLEWHTLDEIARVTSIPPASASARLRDFRKDKFGNHTVLRQRKGEPKAGLFEYKLIKNENKAIEVR